MTHDEARAIRREAHILRSGAGGNRVALAVAHKLIAMTGGEAAMAFDEAPRAYADQSEACSMFGQDFGIECDSENQ